MALADLIECTIDFEGQKQTDKLTHYLLIATGIASFILGYSAQSLQLLLVVFIIGFILTALMVIPPWPMYNKHPQPFILSEKKD
ncbi:microsomal signal peptidase 12 kDa subunit-domain-containing protein [Gilbertella persicaria]|uniref:microsomal signal peptidase 12 kDa subunit-domain-containing protein n=1 Tax=Gilbertella persicaria TaxID=101096 RepID=UPI00221FEB3D|nr:microsomal signal peptidase 12 kDa subunit-domain-containing protein [Gilbertella persicaria]KAI8079497.1 microsomal signal peptidase 12 kDa subunit-domain-containing protein [Gilbertella persicaria]